MEFHGDGYFPRHLALDTALEYALQFHCTDPRDKI
jgi:hypothetical protein